MKSVCIITPRHRPFPATLTQIQDTLSHSFSVAVMVSPGLVERAVPSSSGILHRLSPTQPGWMEWYRFHKRVLKSGADIYHLTNPSLWPLAMLLRFKGKMVVMEIPDMPEWMKPSTPKTWIQKRFLRGLNHIPLILRQRSLIPWFQDKHPRFSVVEHMANPGWCQPWINLQRSANRRILISDELSEINGVVKVVEALSILHRKGIHLTLDLCGPITDSGLVQACESLPGYQAIKSRIFWHGALPSSALYECAAQAIAGICLHDPEAPDTQDHYPECIFDYMGIGLPIIATQVGLYRSLVERRECGVCVPFEAQDLAHALESLLQHPDQVHAYSAQGPTVLKNHYPWHLESRVLSDFYQGLLKK